MYHPTVMGRAGIFKSNHFNDTMSNSEDYELWSRLLFKVGVRFANMPTPLLKYRIYPQSFTRSLNLDRRALSAHNTIRNVEEYVALSKDEKDFIIHLRQERTLRPGELLIGPLLYLKATLSFINKEDPGIREIFGIWGRYAEFVWRLSKHELKKLLGRG
jgi:hypothetical protein